MNRHRWIILVVVVIAAGGVGWTVTQNIGVRDAVLARLGSAPQPAGWVASGFIEAEQVDLSPEIAGRVAALPFDEGAEARAGDVLLRLEDDVLSAQVELARGKLEEAQATLARVKAGTRQETLDKFAAEVALAQAARDGARQAWLDAQAIRDNPQTLDVQIAAARAQATAAQKQYEASLAQRDIAEEAWKNYGKGVGKLADIPENLRPAMPTLFYLVPYQWEQALAATEAAKAANDGARSALNHLLEQRSNPQDAQAQADAAHSRYQSAEAAAVKAQAALDALRAGATADQVAIAQAQVDLTQAEVEAAQLQLGKATVRAPRNGMIMARSVTTGEVTAPNVTALTLADLDSVTLTIYVAGSRLGEIWLGQSFDVRVDAYADRVFPGAVTTISDKAEFTPRNVRSPDQRATLVYSVKLKVANPDRALKPGMPAEVKR